MKTLTMLLAFVALANAGPQAGYPVMPSILTDNMVLQQKAKVPFWGRALPGTEIAVKPGWGKVSKTKVRADSTWLLKIQTTKAGGPYEVTVTVGDSTIIYKNVMLGEVWVCSGQSNMEMPLAGWPPENLIQNSAQEIQNANYPNIRLFTVTRAVSNAPEFNCGGTWSQCDSQTAAKFSAAGYFFGRKLYQELKVPIGLVFTSWGGTKVQSWISGKYLGQVDRYKGLVDSIGSVGGEVKKLDDWIHSHPAVEINTKAPDHQWEGLEFGDSSCSQRDFPDSTWRTMKLPRYWETTEVGDFDGVVWFRKKIEIPDAWIGRSLVIELGPIDDMDRTFVNGVRVGGFEGAGYWQTPRVYSVPQNIVTDSILTIAVRVLDNGGGGGIWGNGVKMQIHPANGPDSLQAVPLSGDWKYLPVAEYIANKFYVYGIKDEEFYSRPKTTLTIGPNTPTMLYNGMIAPIVPYGIKGVIWYQGESNSDLPEEYDNYGSLFALMIKNWRAEWGEGNFPFYFVQIAPFTYGPNSKSYVVRDAQRRTLSVANTGMAVTLDIASITTIHPSDKQDVGLRLAYWALAKDYHKKILCSGPLYKSMKIQKGRAILSFDYAGKGLVMKDSSGETNFLIAGKDSVFVKANVKVDGQRLIVYSDSVKNPIAVRYAWTNTDVATLFNKEGLPASTFRTDNWKQ